MLDLRQLQYFVAVAEEGQMTRAAAKMHVAQPALSQAIAQLEARLGVSLLERHARGVSLTDAGESFLAKARAAVTAAAAADRTAQAFARAGSGRLELGHIGPAPQYTVPRALSAFAAAAPRAEISLRHMSFPTGATASWLEDVDVALCHAPAKEAEVRIHILREEPRTLLVPSTNPLARHEAVPVAEVLAERFISFHPAVQREWASFHQLDDHRGGPPSELTGHHVTTPPEMLMAIASRSAVTVVPHCDAVVVVKALRGVAAVRLLGAEPMRMALVVRKRPHNALVAAFIAAARATPEHGDGEVRHAGRPPQDTPEARPRRRTVRAASAPR